jgi:hypothetical protein
VDAHYPVSVKQCANIMPLKTTPSWAVVSNANMAIVPACEMGCMVLKTRLMMKWARREASEIYWHTDNKWLFSEMCYRVILKTDVHFLYYSTLHVKIILSRSPLRTWKVVHFLCCWSKEVKLFIKVWQLFPCWVSPFHHGMARPQVADGGDALQVWRVAANILNKQSRTADKGWSSSLGVGRGANNSP